jgi:hypothetical protein
MSDICESKRLRRERRQDLLIDLANGMSANIE